MNTVEYTKAMIKPEKVEKSRDGYYFYNYDIQEDTTAEINKYSYLTVEIEGEPDYRKCVTAVINTLYTADKEFDFINSIVSAIISKDTEKLESTEVEYKAYRDKVAEIKSKVKEDFAD